VFDVNNDPYFETEDPRGIVVICTSQCWFDHILDGHPELEGWEESVIAAISTPLYGCIYRSAHHESRSVYYWRPPKSRYYLKVIVSENSTGPSEIMTAHFVGNVPPGEVMIWPESK
jgi:hypothetical protein